MDLIYTNAQREDLGVLLDYEMDLAFGADENNFECTVSDAAHCCEAGSCLYIEGTEYGGVVDAIQIKSASKEVIYSGRTWHGILGSKIILPLQKGESATEGVTIKQTDSSGTSLADRYLIISGDAHDCLRFIISRIGLADTFTVSDDASGVAINQHQFKRYTDAYSGIARMLSGAGLKLKVQYTRGRVNLSAVAIYDYSEDEQFDSDLVEFDLKKSYHTVNHLICLGAGELENRLVIHLYADAQGNISQTQTQFGDDEYADIFEYSSVESEEELISEGIDHLKALWEQDKLSVDFDESMDNYDVGDVVGAVDNITGTRITSTISKKVVTISNGKITIDLQTDSESSSSTNASGDGGSKENTTQTIMEAVYPVGSIYMSANSTNPATLFGFGVWAQIKDTFLLASGNTYTAGSTGGEATVKLSLGQMPKHGHLVRVWDNTGSTGNAYYYDGQTKQTHNGARIYYSSASTWIASGSTASAAAEGAGDPSGGTSQVGSGSAHNNMPPYLAVYVWKRTA